MATLSASIHSEADLQTLLTTICNDLGRTLDKWTLFKRLAEAQRGEFWKGMAQSQSFWSMVLGGLQDAVVAALCRAYDDHRDALTLRTVIKTLMLAHESPARIPAFLKTLPLIPIAELQADLKSVDRRSDKTVKHLLMWRDKFYAHRDAEKIVAKRTLGQEYPLSYGDVDNLLENAFRIVNRYSAGLFRNSHAKGMSGADDYLTLLRTLQSDIDARDAEIREQFRQAGIEFDGA
jgi:hypothetical protein